MFKQFVDRILGYRETLSVRLSETELEHILAHYFNDDFTLVQQDSNNFMFIANMSVGTAMRNEIQGGDIILNCQIEREDDTVNFNFSAPGQRGLLFITAVLFLISFSIITKEIWVGALVFLLSIAVFFWFRAVIHHQQKTILKYFKEDLKKFRHFKNKGFDYFSRKSH